MKKPPPSEAPRNFLGRREQIRLLTLVFSLGLVLIFIGEAAKPKNWYWLWGGHPPNGSPATDRGPEPPDESQPVDTRLRPDGGSAEPNQPLVVASGPSNKEAAWEVPSGVVHAKHLMPGVRREDLETIRDDVAFGGKENEIFYRWLAQCDHLGSRRLAERSLGTTSYLQLFKQNDVYRGRVVSLKGTVRRALRVRANENELGVETYYRLWLQPDDRPTLPIVVYCMRLPEGFPVETEVKEEVALTAVPLKRWPYLAHDTMRLAPLVIAATVEWRPEMVAARSETTGLRISLIVVTAAALATVAVLVIVKRTNQPRPTNLLPLVAAFQAVHTIAASDDTAEEDVVSSMKACAEPEGMSDETAGDADRRNTTNLEDS